MQNTLRVTQFVNVDAPGIEGVFHPRGGCGAVAAAMARVAGRLGAEIRLGCPVESIVFEGRRATGVRVGGAELAADAVVMNADFAHATPKLIPNGIRKAWSDGKIAKARYSCSTFMLYLGVEGSYPELAHHNIYIAKDYQRNLAEIEQDHRRFAHDRAAHRHALALAA